MGTDVHFAFQCRPKNKKIWTNLTCSSSSEKELYRNSIFDGRCSDFFQWLRDVAEELGQEGCPSELRNRQLYYDKKWDCYDWDTVGKEWMFGYGYATLAQLREATKKFTKSLKDGLWVSENFYEQFIAAGGEFPESFIVDNGDFKVISEEDQVLLEIIEEFLKKLSGFANYYKLEDSELRVCWAFDN